MITIPNDLPMAKHSLSASDSSGGDAKASSGGNVFAKKDRIDWVDYAKGTCIIWVVALYATNFVQETVHAIGWMDYVARFARPFRMPDFFMLSGLFVGQVLNRPWRVYLDTKVLHFFYFYSLWGLLKFINMHTGDFMHVPPSALAAEFLHWYIEPPTGPLWFIYELGIFFLAVRLLRPVPQALVLVAVAALEIADFGGTKVLSRFADYFVFFYFGYLFSKQIFRAANWAYDNVRPTLVLLLIWFCINTWLVMTDRHELPGIRLALGITGGMAVMLVATLLTRSSAMRWLKYSGQNSIVVYLGFVIPLGLLRRFIVEPVLITDIGTLSVLVGVLSAAGAILLYWVLRRTPLRFLYVRPSWSRLTPERGAPLKTGVGAKPVAD
jgi:uncharacterized membrane protein YcfT